MTGILDDVRLGLRLLARHPGFACVAVLTLALGIGANTALFSVVDGVLLRPAPVADLDRLAVIWETDRNSGTTREPASVPDYLDFVERCRSFEALGAMAAGEVNLTPAAGDPVRLAALSVTHRFLPMLGMAPLLGRGFAAEEDRPGGPRVALISRALWERGFGGRPGILGETLALDDVPHAIVGVMPDATDFGALQVLSAAAYSRGFADHGGGIKVDVWTPLQADPASLPRQTHPIFVLGRLAAGATAAAAGREMDGITAALEGAYPENAGRGAFVEPLREVVFGPVRPALLILLGAVALMLLVACVNVACLLLARGAARAREVAVRAALGASRGRLARQFLAETLVLVGVAAAAGLALAAYGTEAMVAFAPGDVPRLDGVSIDLRVLAATTLVTLLVGLAFGLVPTIQARRLDVQAARRSSGGPQASAGRDSGRLRSALVVAELSLGVVLVVGAGLLLKSFWRLSQVDPGFRAAGVLKAEYQLPASRYPASISAWPVFKEAQAFTDRLLEKAAALPGVTAAAIAGNHPLDPGFTSSFSVVGREAEARGWPEIAIRRVTPGYFQAVGLALLRGRPLAGADRVQAPQVLLINESAARRFFPGRDPIGARIRLWGAERAIVGVVADERSRGLGQAAPIAVYLPLAQAPSLNGSGVLLLRAGGEAASLTAAVRGLFHDLDPGLAVFGVEPLEATVLRSVSQRRFTMFLLSAFAAATVLLASVGVYGVLSYAVVRRTREFGIRMALGAPPSRVLRSVLRQGLVLSLLGLAAGVAGALALTHFLKGLLFGVGPTDPATFLAVALFLVAVALVAGYMPARRAMRIDPAAALRGE